MTIVEELKKLIVSKGGSAIGIQTIAEAVKKLQQMEDAANPLSALLVDVNIAADTDLLGKVIGDLQDNVVVDTNKITGELYYVDDYSGFSGDVELQSGNYLAVHASVPEVSNVTIKLKISTKEGEKTLDPSDGILILRVTPEYIKSDVKLTFTAYKDGCAPYAKTFDLTGLTLDPAEDEE